MKTIARPHENRSPKVDPNPNRFVTRGSYRAPAARKGGMDCTDVDLRHYFASDRYPQFLSEIPDEAHACAVDVEIKCHHRGYLLVLKAAANGLKI